MKYEDPLQSKRGNGKDDKVLIPFFEKPYPIPSINQGGFKKEVNQQCYVGTMK